MSMSWKRLKIPALVGASICLLVTIVTNPMRAADRELRPEGGQLVASKKDVEYVDGSYTATGQYGSQPSFITVTVSLADGIITAVKVQPHAYVATSLDLQRRFAAAVPREVVGRRIDEVNVGKLAGSSGTPIGFNDAIAQIRRQAVATKQ